MKKIAWFMLLIMIQFCLMPIVPATADNFKTGRVFSLRNGRIIGAQLGGTSFLRQHFLETNLYDTGEKYRYGSQDYDSYGITASSTGTPNVGDVNTEFGCTGNFDPRTGLISGTWFFRQTHYVLAGSGAEVPIVECETSNGKIMGFVQPGDKMVQLTFIAHDFSGDSRDVLNRPRTVDGYHVEYVVEYDVQGTLPFDEIRPANQDSGIRISKLAGKVEVLFPLEYDLEGVEQYNKTAWEAAKMDMKLPFSTMIRTGPGSTVKLTFPDGTTLQTEGEGIFRLAKDPAVEPQESLNRVKLLQGQMWSGPAENRWSCLINNGPMTIDMSQCTVGIKGTSLEIEDDGLVSTVKVLTGTVEVHSKAGGGSTILKEGEMVSVTAQGLGEKKSFEATGTTGISSETFESGARMSWNSYAGAIGYRLYRSTNSGQLGLSVTDFYITSFSFADVNVEPDSTYYYSVKPVLAEANPYEGIAEKLGPVIATFTVRTGGSTYKPGSFKNFIILKLNDPYLTQNGIKAEIDPGRGTTPLVISSRTMVPIRAIVEAMGGNALWDEAVKKITLNARGNTVEMWLGKTDIAINGAYKKMDVSPLVRNARTFVPVRFAAENLNCKVDWLNSTQEVIIVYED